MHELKNTPKTYIELKVKVPGTRPFNLSYRCRFSLWLLLYELKASSIRIIASNCKQ